MKNESIKTRAVKQGRAKDYERDAKYYPYYYITVKNKDYTLAWGGWSSETRVLHDAIGNYTVIDGVKYYLNF